MSKAMDDKKPRITKISKGLKNFKEGRLMRHLFDFESQSHYNPVMTSKSAFYTFISLTVVFLLLLTILFFSKDAFEMSIRYDNLEDCNIGFENPSYGKTCEIKMKITEKVKLPVNVFYEVSDFYQNHQIFRSSFSEEQQEGSLKETEGCSKLEKFNGKTLYPCGMNPNSIFSDRIVGKLNRKSGQTIHFVPWEDEDKDNLKESPMWRKKGILRDLYIREQKSVDVTSAEFLNGFTREGPEQSKINEYLSNKGDTRKVVLPLPTDEDLVVWQRVSPWPIFRKIYRRIELFDEFSEIEYLEEGDVITFRVQNFFKVDGKRQTKKLVLASKSFLGVQNVLPLIVACGVLAGISFLMVVAIFLNVVYFPRLYGDVSLLK